jgi:hypothetical protein
MSDQLSPEQIRIEMKRRFDAINEEAENRHRRRRELGDIRDAKIYDRATKSRESVDDLATLGENDSSGG